MRMRLFLILCILMISFSSASQTAVVVLDEEQEPRTVRNTTTSGYVEEVPYVWQQINGYCMPSAISMTLQSMGIEMDLATLFAATGAGFSAVYVNVEDMWSFYPGVMSRQAQWFESFAELHGLEAAIYLDSDTDYGLTAAQAVAGMGQEFIDYHMENVTPIDIVRSTIDAGYPLAIVVDTFYLPHEDWDIVRDMGITLQNGGVGHAIAIVGYDDLTRRVQVYDPGIGLNADDYGYPSDGSYNYSMAYSTLDVTWRSAGYVAFYVAPGSGPPEDYQERLAKYVTERLLGNRTSYFRGYESFFYMSAGSDAFKGLALDMTPATIESYVRRLPEQYWQQALALLGTNLEAFLTMQYYSYRSALARLPGLLLDYNLTEFVGIAAEALPHMEALTSNISVRASADIVPRDSLFFETFYNISQRYSQTLDLTSAVREYSDSLEEIAGHCVASAGYWVDAGRTLARLVETHQGSPTEQILLAVTGGCFIVISCVIMRKRRNQ